MTAEGELEGAEPTGLFQALETTEEMAAATSSRAWLEALLRFEVGLARAEAEVELIPEAAARAIAEGAGRATLDPAAIGDRFPYTGTPVVPLLLAEPALPWHGDRLQPTRLACALAMVCGVGGKVALDVLLLSQTELQEVAEAEAPGQGGSSAIPHKRNAVISVAILAGQRRAAPLAAQLLSSMPQPLDRAAGGWQAEWPTVTELLRLTGGVASRLRALLEGLRVDEGRMARNLQLTRGAVLSERLASSLAKHLGRAEARRLLEEAFRRSAEAGTALGDELRREGAVSSKLGAELERLLDPGTYLGSSSEFIDRALARAKEGA